MPHVSFRSFSIVCLSLLLAPRSANAGDRISPADPLSYAALRWRMIGPFRGGRTPVVAGVPGQPDVFYIAANNGGVWKSNDAGRVWKPIFDQQPTGSIGSLAVAPSDSNVIYVGSGEGLQRPDLSVGDGIYKSTDAGATWEHLGLRDGQQIPAILVDPRDANRLFVAVLGHPYGPNEERGVFRSTDGGKTFQKVLYKDENIGAIDLAFDPANSRIIYAALWAARQAPWEIGASFSAPGSGLFKSTDDGSTWRQLTKGLPSSRENPGRIGIGIAPGDANRIYALVDAPETGGLFRSEDAGESWTRVNREERVCGRGGDFAGVRVDPKNRDTIYVANTSTYRSTDAGKTFTAIKGAPGGDDYHSIWINPENPRIILLGSDQGATITVNGGETWSSWYNQPTAQFYHVSTDNRFPYWVYGGQQESGSAAVASRGSDGAVTFRDWHPVGAEEYGYVAPDPIHPNLAYGGKISRFDWNTGQVQDVSPAPLRSDAYRFVRTLPVLFSPVDPRVLYLGANVLFRTTDGGNRWEVMSPDLTRESYETPRSLGVFAASDPEKGKHRGVIYTLAPSWRDINHLWAGTDDGWIHVTRDGGKHWTNVTPAALTPWSKVSLIEASHFNEETAYAAVNRFRLDDLRPHIYRTRDGGKSWTEIVRGIPDNEVVNSVREDPVRRGLLFAGTERAAYVSFDDGDSWRTLRLNMPATSIRDLAVHGSDLIVGTHGRSFWILDDIEPLREWSGEIGRAPIHLFAPDAAYRVRRDLNTDTPLPPEEPAGENPPDGAIFDFVLKTVPRGPVLLEILNHNGNLVRRFTSEDVPEPVDPGLNVPVYWLAPTQILPATAGMHRFVWDLRFPPPKALHREPPISAVFGGTPLEPLGPLVLPGEYTVRLTVGGSTETKPLTVKMDPRVVAAPTALEGQLGLAQRICAAMASDAAARESAGALRSQLRDLRTKSDAKLLVEKIEALDAALAALESGSPKVAPGAAPSQSLRQIAENLSDLLGVVEGADAAPTTQAVAAVTELEHRLQGMSERWRALEANELAALNEELRRAKLGELKEMIPR